ncbi:hypothetical protein CRENBAI_008677 [Crenichthys baileyi]|uniref:Uncharacterized protein n=1 Tax=Crenichthys baileyi TaxID=28760 RepID=A0AAV9RS87_9TELE
MGIEPKTFSIPAQQLKPLCQPIKQQSMDLALGQTDGDTKSKLKELLLNLVEDYNIFVLYNIRKRRLRSGDVAVVVAIRC